MKDGWKKYDSFGFEFEEGLDLSALVEQDYYLELYLKNTDPTLTFDYHLEISQSDTSVGNPPMYGTGLIRLPQFRNSAVIFFCGKGERPLLKEDIVLVMRNIYFCILKQRGR